MPETGKDALNGTMEHISGHHTFTVEDQTTVVAKGMLIMIYGPNSPQARWHGRNTGEDGKAVSRGETVQVYNVDVEFRK